MASTAVRWARSRSRGDSVRDAGRCIGISGATVSRIEAGKMVDVVTYAKVCAWLGCSLDKFVERPPWQLDI